MLMNLEWIPLGCGTWSFFVCCCWICFANILFRIFVLYFSKLLACNLIFWCYPCLVLVWGEGGFIECLWKCFLLFNLLEEFEKDWYKFFFGRICLWSKPSGLELLLVGSFFFSSRYQFTSSDRSIQIIYLFLIQFWWAICF